MQHSPQQHETIIVGAGPAGLAVAGCLAVSGLPFLLIEAADKVGPRWHDHYRRLHLHTPGSDSTLPYLDFPRGTPRYPSRQQVVEYLESYARKFRLQPRFGCRLTRLSRAADGWRLETSGDTLLARRVVICTGYNRQPQLPDPGSKDAVADGQRVMHSISYRDAGSVPGPRNLVVGMGNSGAEIALDLAEAGRQVDLSVRGPLNVVPRDLYGLPLNTIARLSRLIPDRWAEKLNRRTLNRLYGDLPGYGLHPLPYSAHCQIDQHQRVPLIDVGTIDAIRRGAITVRPGIGRIGGTRVRFVDGSEHDYDGVVLATGYRPRLQELMPDLDGLLNAAGAPLSSGTELQPGLYFCGFRVSTRGMLKQINLEARAIAGLLRAAA